MQGCSQFFTGQGYVARHFIVYITYIIRHCFRNGRLEKKLIGLIDGLIELAQKSCGISL